MVAVGCVCESVCEWGGVGEGGGGSVQVQVSSITWVRRVCLTS